MGTIQLRKGNSVSTIPIERALFGNELWRSPRAINEIEIYCDLLDYLQDRIDSLEVRGKDEEVTLVNVQAVISSYAFEIAMKSLWALDHPNKKVPHTHDLVTIFDGLKETTVESLMQLHLTRKGLNESPSPFYSNRYSMEHSDRDISVYEAEFLRLLAKLLEEKLNQTAKELLSAQ